MARATHQLTRRRLLGTFAVLPVLPRLQEASPVSSPEPVVRGSHLRILMPAHPLSGYNDAVRSLTTGWAASEGVTFELDIVPAIDIPAAVEIQLAEGAGHDLVGTDMPLLHHAGEMRDLSTLFARAEDRFGPASQACAAATALPDGGRPAFSLAYAPAPLIYRRSIWEAYGLPDGPLTWDQLHKTGAQIWREAGMNVGLGLAPEPGSERVAAMILDAFGAAMMGDDGEVALESDEAVAAVQFTADLYRDAMSPESFEWDTGRPARLLADGIASIISDDITALRLAQGRGDDIARDLFLAPPPAGPSGAPAHTLPTSFRAFHILRHAANPGAAESFLLMLAASSEALVGSGRLTDRPAYGSLVPGLVQAGGWLDADPFGAEPREKFAMLKGSAAWTAAPAGALATRAHAGFLLSRMMARAARGEATPETAVAKAANELREMR